MELRINDHKGMGTQIAKEKLPTWLYQKIHNLELSKKLGRLVKRGGYANVLTTGLTALNGMKEFTDNNGGRQILLQDGTGLEESVYTGGAYGAIAALSGESNDERTASAQVTQMHPILHEKVLRSGASITHAKDYPFWYGYKDAVIRYPNSGDEETIAAGKYLEDQFYFGALNSLISITMTNSVSGGAATPSANGIDEGMYGIYLIPVLDGYQRMFPETGTNVFATHEVDATTDVAKRTISIKITIAYGNRAKYKRITDIDIFISKITNGIIEDADINPAYFLERVPLDDDGDYIHEFEGNSDTGGSVVWTTAEVEWLTHPFTSMWIYNETQDESYRVTGMNYGTNTMSVTPSPSATQAGDTFKVFSRWYKDTDFIYGTFYDDYYRKLGSEMYTYLDIPTADTGLDDVRYKFSCMANKRYFIFGTPDGAFGYYSKVNNPDVIPSQNILRLQRELTACISVGRDVIAFYPASSKRFTILSNTNADEDDTFSDIGCVGQKAVINITDEEAYGMDLRGPWGLHLRNHRFIGSLLTDWWEDELSDAEKNACVVGYNRLKDWVLYSFPTYTGTHDSQTYSNGIVFVFDRGFYLKSGRQVEPWWILKTDQEIYDWSVAEDDDLHLLTGSKTAIVDWNEPDRDDQDESVTTLLHAKLLKNPVLGNKTHFDMLYLYYVSATDAMVGNIRPDGGSWVTLTINDDQQAVIKYLCETLELELSTAASTNDVEISEQLLTFSPLRGA